MTFFAAVFASQAIAETKVIDTFEDGKLKWETQKPIPGGHLTYAINAEIGNSFLHAAPQKGAEGIVTFRRFPINVHQTPILKWSWRALALPEGANEGVKGKNDCAAGVYVYMQKGPTRRVLKYTWSTNRTDPSWLLSSGSKWFWKTQIKTLRHGPPLNTWVEESVDIEKDFKEAYGSDAPSQAEGIGILTDGDQTNTIAIADYDDFRVESRPPTPK